MQSNVSTPSQWAAVSATLVDRYLQHDTPSARVIQMLADRVGISGSEFTHQHVDHLTVNLLSEGQADVLGNALANYALEHVQDQVFVPGQVEGRLYTLTQASPYYRRPGVSGSGILSVFVRYFSSTRLGELRLSDSNFVEEIGDLVELVSEWRMGVSAPDVSLSRFESNVSNNGSFGHLALDLRPVGVTLDDVTSWCREIAPLREHYRTYSSANATGTIRQLYLLPRMLTISSEDRELSLEPFLELIEREETGSITSVSNRAVEVTAGFPNPR